MENPETVAIFGTQYRTEKTKENIQHKQTKKMSNTKWLINKNDKIKSM
jgi:hypothetical protein